jgi:hypothetical protein
MPCLTICSGKRFALHFLYINIVFQFRENLRKANSARRKTKDFSADLHLKIAHDDSSPVEKSSFMSRDRLDSHL